MPAPRGPQMNSRFTSVLSLAYVSWHSGDAVDHRAYLITSLSKRSSIKLHRASPGRRHYSSSNNLVRLAGVVASSYQCSAASVALWRWTYVDTFASVL